MEQLMFLITLTSLWVCDVCKSIEPRAPNDNCNTKLEPKAKKTILNFSRNLIK